MAVGLLIFYAFCLQCAATIAVIYRETNSLGWPVFAWLYMTGLGYAGRTARLPARQLRSTLMPGPQELIAMLIVGIVATRLAWRLRKKPSGNCSGCASAPPPEKEKTIRFYKRLD